MEVGDIVQLGIATPITRVIFDYNRSYTCVRVKTKYSSYTDEKVMPLKEGCKVWICSKGRPKMKRFCFMSFKMRAEDARIEHILAFDDEKDIEQLKFTGEINYEMEEFLIYALKRLTK